MARMKEKGEHAVQKKYLSAAPRWLKWLARRYVTFA